MSDVTAPSAPLSQTDVAAPAPRESSRFDPRWLAAGGVLLLLIWSYFPILRVLAREWEKNPNYSSGMLVPIGALYMLWMDRDKLAKLRVKPAWIGGLLLILFGQAVRLHGVRYVYESLERYSFIFTLAGLVLLITGWQITRHAKWSIVLLFLMIPLPESIHNRISSPLQDMSTNGAVMTLETMGMTVAQEGHEIKLNNTVPLTVAEACSGLRMLTAFIFVAAVFAHVVNRPGWQKIALVASSVPIAILCNLLRIVMTALVYMLTSSNDFATKFFHDFAGLTMMPLAIAMLMGELWVMSKIVVEEKR